MSLGGFFGDKKAKIYLLFLSIKTGCKNYLCQTDIRSTTSNWLETCPFFKHLKIYKIDFFRFWMFFQNHLLAANSEKGNRFPNFFFANIRFLSWTWGHIQWPHASIYISFVKLTNILMIFSGFITDFNVFLRYISKKFIISLSFLSCFSQDLEWVLFMHFSIFFYSRC